MADFFSAGTLTAFGLSASRELLGLCRAAEGGFVLGLARVFEVLLDFPAVTVCWGVLEVLGSSWGSALATLEVLLFGKAEDDFAG